ncbi:MAG: hypothetical protein IJ925_01975 [Muribaculaceae bacterium]|nr:hypothetical protein [Muribaculaceae bacterium]
MKHLIHRTLLFVVVALLAASPIEINAQSGNNHRTFPSSSTSRSGRSSRSSSARASRPSGNHQSRNASSRKGSSSSNTSFPITLNDYLVDFDYVDDYGNACVAFYIDFNIKNRKNQLTYVCVKAYKGDNYTAILNSWGQPIVTDLGFTPNSNVSQHNIATLTIPLVNFLNATNWDIDNDGLTFDLVFEDRDRDLIGILEDLDF